MKLVSLEASNFKRLRAFRLDIDENKNLVILEGKNGAGKTSALDILWAAIDYASFKKENPFPVFAGEQKAYVTVNLGTLKITRRWTEKGSYIQVENAEGAVFKSPQTILDDLKGALTIDPLAFARMDGKEQRKVLLSFLDVNLEELEERRRVAFEERTIVGRDVKAIEAALTQLSTVPDGTPEVEVSIDYLMAELDAALAHNKSIEDRDTKIANMEQSLEGISEQILEYRRMINGLEEAHALTIELIKKEKEKGSNVVPVDIEEIKTRGRNVEATNTNVRLKKQRASMEADLVKTRDLFDEKTKSIQACDAEKEKLLSGVALPVPGMAVNPDGLSINNIPLSQCSAAEQLKISTWIAMKLNPKLRVLRISDGSLLDPDNLAMMKAMAEDQDYLILMERVGDGRGGLLIEDGVLKG